MSLTWQVIEPHHPQTWEDELSAMSVEDSAYSPSEQIRAEKPAYSTQGTLPSLTPTDSVASEAAHQGAHVHTRCAQRCRKLLS